MKDAVATMGGLLPDDVGGRDAVHVAVFSAVALEALIPGQDVGIIGTEVGDIVVTCHHGSEKVGIVDPFLKKMVQKGERFWVYLYPRTITGLSHQWTHPAFENINTTYSTPSSKLASENWLRGYCEKADGVDYDELIEIGNGMAEGKEKGYFDEKEYYGWNCYSEYLNILGSDAGGEIPSVMWDHLEVVIGKKIAGTKPSYFSCSC